MIKTIPKKKKCKKEKWLSEEALSIVEKRREAKSKGKQERYTDGHSGQKKKKKPQQNISKPNSTYIMHHDQTGLYDLVDRYRKGVSKFNIHL